MKQTLINKPWGKELILIKGKRLVLKIIYINPHSRLSLQYHKKKEEVMIFPNGDVSYIKAKQKHRLTNPSNKLIKIIEVSTPELNDIVRLEDDYGRK